MYTGNQRNRSILRELPSTSSLPRFPGLSLRRRKTLGTKLINHLTLKVWLRKTQLHSSLMKFAFMTNSLKVKLHFVHLAYMIVAECATTRSMVHDKSRCPSRFRNVYHGKTETRRCTSVAKVLKVRLLYNFQLGVSGYQSHVQQTKCF